MTTLIKHRGLFDLLPIEFDPFPRMLRGCGTFAETLANYSTYETEGTHFIRVSLPGHNNDTVKVEAEGDRLRIIAISKAEGFDGELIEDQEFKFKLPKNSDTERIEGSVNDGILSVSIPKIKESASSKKIQVKLGN